MTIELTEEQQKVLYDSGTQPPRVIHPHTHREYVLIPKDEYENLQGQREQQEWHDLAWKSAIARFEEDEG